MGYEILKKWVTFLVLLFPAVVVANPVIFPSVSLISYFIVLGSAFGLEAAIVTLLLLFCYLEPVPLFFAILAGNVVIYFAIFRPLLTILGSVLIAETIIVVLDGAFIKTISLFDTFQREDFQGLKWRTVFIVSAAGNAVSYFLGAIISRY